MEVQFAVLPFIFSSIVVSTDSIYFKVSFVRKTSLMTEELEFKCVDPHILDTYNALLGPFSLLNIPY